MEYSKRHILKGISLSLLSAILLVLSFPKFNLELLAWFGFVPLFFAVRGVSKFKAFLLFYLAGIIFWLGAIYWLAHVTLAGLIILVLYLALYFGLFGIIVSSCMLPATYYLLFIPSLWVLLEYIRSHLFSGFPWALLGYTQYLNLAVIQIADITGAWGISFLVMAVNVAVYLFLVSRRGDRIKRTSCLVILLSLAVVLVYGYYRLSQKYLSAEDRQVKISVIQANIPQALKWQPESNRYIMDRYLGLSTYAVTDKPDLIIWPEAALPVVLEEEPVYYELTRDFIREIKTPLLLGAVRLRRGNYFNSALLLSSEGELLGNYDKLHLVPFGEYIPFRNIFKFLENIAPIGDFQAGSDFTVFGFPEKFSVLVCFEDLFPQISRAFVNRGAAFLVNITNDAWFHKTSSPYQHLQASVLRAVENRVYVVRAANTGVSAFIAPTGRIISSVHDRYGEKCFISGYKSDNIYAPARPLTFYSRYGDIFILACLLLFLCGIIFAWKKK